MTPRTYAVTGAGSGIGAATARRLRADGHRVIACDLIGADVAGDLATADGRAALVEGVSRLCDGRLDGIVANAGGGPPQTLLALNFFGAVATLEGLRPLLAGSPAPRAVAVSSISCLAPPDPALVEACIGGDEPAAEAIGQVAIAAGRAGELYGCAKHALNTWSRRAAVTADWAGAGIVLNAVAPGVIETPAASWILDDPDARAEMERRVPMACAMPGHADDMAALLAWCVSAENTLMCGQVLFFDGGVECAARGEAHW